MRLNEQQVIAAHNLGEAILQFVVAVGSGTHQRTRPTTGPTDSQIVNGAVRNLATVRADDHALVPAGVVAQMLALSRSKVYGLMETGELPYVKLGKSRRIRISDVQRLITDNLVSRRHQDSELISNPGGIKR